jgi:hypothetical protein
MADVVKKVVVENVPKIFGSGYTIRYRVVSEDRNRTSHWSPMHTFQKDIPTEEPISVDGEIVFVSNRQVSATWEEINANLVYEIFINWNDEVDEELNLVWTYMRTVSSPTYTTLAPTGAESVSIWVQQPTSNQVQEPLALIFTESAENTFTS